MGLAQCSHLRSNGVTIGSHRSRNTHADAMAASKINNNDVQMLAVLSAGARLEPQAGHRLDVSETLFPQREQRYDIDLTTPITSTATAPTSAKRAASGKIIVQNQPSSRISSAATMPLRQPPRRCL